MEIKWIHENENTDTTDNICSLLWMLPYYIVKLVPNDCLNSTFLTRTISRNENLLASLSLWTLLLLYNRSPLVAFFLEFMGIGFVHIFTFGQVDFPLDIRGTMLHNSKYCNSKCSKIQDIDFFEVHGISEDTIHIENNVDVAPWCWGTLQYCWGHNMRVPQNFETQW